MTEPTEKKPDEKLSEGCQAFIESVITSSMMGAGLALLSVPPADRPRFMAEIAENVTQLALLVHSRLHSSNA